MEDTDRPRLNLADFIKPENSLKITYETLLKEDSVNKLRFTPDHQIYPFNISDLDLRRIISSSEKSTVKKYLHKPSKQIIAVKCVHIPYSIYKDEKKEKEMQKVIQEIKIHQQLSFSKHIVKLYGFCIYEGDALICMELMDMSLKEFYMYVHEKYNYFPEDLLGVICASIVSAFQDLHRFEIIHRDIKPNNILINFNGQVKLCDFGEARLLENNLATSIVGTVAYWPPERMKGERAYDSRSDIWSLGITLAELIYGKLPFEDEGGNELDNCPMVMFYIMNLNTAELVHKCFSRANCSYEYARDFVASCLGKCEDRPNYEDLLKTAFYRRYCDLARDKIVKKYMDSSLLVNTNKRRQSSSNSKFESYTHWERNLNGKMLSTENKMHLNVQKHFKIPFKIPRRYIPNEKVGVGVRGVTMKAFDNKLHKFVAIKELSYIYMKSGEAYREFMLLQKLDHKNIAKLYDAYTPATSADNFFQLYFVMDYIEFPLRLVIYNRQMIFGQDGGHLNIAFLMFQLLSGINYLHSIGIVHRELSPDSIVVSKDFHLKIAHLGLVQVLDANRKKLSYSNASAYLTTSAYYRAPEILLDHEYNHKVDLWSIGCILAELLTGNHLFRGNSFVFLFKESNYYFQLVKIIEILQLTTENLSFKPDELSHEYIFTIKEEINKIFIRLQTDKPIPWETLFSDSVFPRANKNVSKITFLKEWNHKKLAQKGRDFISRLIEINPEKRISSEEALRHPFLKPYDSQKVEKPKEKINLEEIFEAKKITYEEWNEFLFGMIKNYEKKQNFGKEHEYLEKINGVYQVAE